MGFGFLNALTSFGTGAAAGANQEFDQANKEQQRQDTITQQLVSKAALDLQKKQEAAQQRVTFKRGIQQVYGVENDQADAIADLPETIRANPDALNDYIGRMKAIPGKTVPATQQTIQQIRAPQQMRTGAITPNVNIPGVQVPVGEAQPERQAYELTHKSDDMAKYLPHMQPSNDPTVNANRAEMVKAIQAGTLSQLDPSIVVSAMGGQKPLVEDHALNQTMSAIKSGLITRENAPDFYKQAGGKNPIDFSKISDIGTAESNPEVKARMIREAIKNNDKPALISLGVIKPVTEGGNVGTLDMNSSTFTPASTDAGLVTLKDKGQAQQELASLTNNSALAKKLKDIVVANPSVAGIPGEVSDKFGGPLTSIASAVAGQKAGDWVNDFTNASKNQEFRRQFEALVAESAKPILDDKGGRYTSKEEFRRAEQIIGHANQWWHDPRQVAADLESLNYLHQNMMYKQVMQIPGLRPQEFQQKYKASHLIDLTKIPSVSGATHQDGTPRTAFDDYADALMQGGNLDEADTQGILDRIIKRQAGKYY